MGGNLFTQFHEATPTVDDDVITHYNAGIISACICTIHKKIWRNRPGQVHITWSHVVSTLRVLWMTINQCYLSIAWLQ